jgi:hypothetical protein
MSFLKQTFLSTILDVVTGWKKSTTNQPSLQDDIELEGRTYDEELKIAESGIIDQSRIRSWWTTYKTTAEYNVVLNNCGQVVRTALIKGGIEETLPWYNKIGYYALYPLNTAPAVLPNDVLKWIKYVVKLHGKNQT